MEIYGFLGGLLGGGIGAPLFSFLTKLVLQKDAQGDKRVTHESAHRNSLEIQGKGFLNEKQKFFIQEKKERFKERERVFVETLEIIEEISSSFSESTLVDDFIDNSGKIEVKKTTSFITRIRTVEKRLPTMRSKILELGLSEVSNRVKSRLEVKKIEESGENLSFSSSGVIDKLIGFCKTLCVNPKISHGDPSLDNFQKMVSFYSTISIELNNLSTIISDFKKEEEKEFLLFLDKYLNT
jgi:hypothetical protein